MDLSYPPKAHHFDIVFLYAWLILPVFDQLFLRPFVHNSWHYSQGFMIAEVCNKGPLIGSCLLSTASLRKDDLQGSCYDA